MRLDDGIDGYMEDVKSGRIPWLKKITVSLNAQKHFRLPIERSFSVGQHPIVVSLIDQYLETFFCPGQDNGVILLSLSSIDIYSRGSGLTWFVPLNRVLGNIKDKIVAGVWCSYAERLILVGQYNFYVFNISRYKMRCGCGARCCTCTISSSMNRIIVPRCRYPIICGDYIHSRRFLASNHKGLLFYGELQQSLRKLIFIYRFRMFVIHFMYILMKFDQSNRQLLTKQIVLLFLVFNRRSFDTKFSKLIVECHTFNA